MSEAPPAPAMGYSIVANLGNDRQITCQCFVGHDEPLPIIHDKIDKVQEVIDRQRARYQIKDLTGEREKHVLALGRVEDDLARVEQDHQVKLAALNTRIGLLADDIRAIDDQAHARGRNAPVGGDAARRRAMEAEQKELAASRASLEAEREQHRQNVLISIDRFREAVKDCDTKIAEAQALIDGG